jgi:hypothetical protein
MDLTCYLHPGWQPLIRPASARRDWMDDTPDSFAYRCLPLNIANAHGWELLNPCAFDAEWNGQSGTNAITIRPEPGGPTVGIATSLFGQGVITFHIPGIFRTPPGWNLWVGGSPNRPKDAIYPLTGVVETDWSPFTFTMNWRFTRPNHRIYFAVGEPICFIFPVQRAVLEDIAPKLAPIDAEPELLERFRDWSKARDAFHQRMSREPPRAGVDKWQKHYYRGVDLSERPQIGDHCTKLHLQPFDTSAIPWPLTAHLENDAATNSAPQEVSTRTEAEVDQTQTATTPSQILRDLRKREWLLETIERQRALSPATVAIERRAALSSEEFLDCYYAANRPVILVGEMSDWPALTRWTPDYLKRAVGSKQIEFQGDRSKSHQFEIYKDDHRREMPFDQFVDLVSRPNVGNDAYMTAYNSTRNADALAALHPDLGFLEKFLSREVLQPNGMMWIGPAGTLTSLHHDLTNNLIAQVVGRKRLLVLPAAEVGKLCNHIHVFSKIADLEDPALSPEQFPRLADAKIYDVTLMPGEMIFMPLAWWHQVKSIDFSVTITYTNFLWPNDGFKNFPTD